MKVLPLIGLFIFLSSCSFAQNKQINILVDSYQKGFGIKGKDSIHYQELFFKAFPANFKSFDNIYGYIDSKPMPLYYASLNHVNAFFSLKCINKDSLTAKVIRIAIGGIWDADGVGYFQHNLQQYAISNNREFVKILLLFSDKEITSVWHFYFDYENSFDQDANYKDMLKLVSPINKKMAVLMTRGYESAANYWKNSH